MLLQCCVRAGTGCLRDVGALGQTGRACELRVGAGVGSLVVWCLLTVLCRAWRARCLVV